MPQDLVCKTAIDENSRFFTEYDRQLYYFCSADCKRSFDDHPDTFIQRTAREKIERLDPE